MKKTILISITFLLLACSNQAQQLPMVGCDINVPSGFDKKSNKKGGYTYLMEKGVLLKRISYFNSTKQEYYDFVSNGSLLSGKVNRKGELIFRSLFLVKPKIDMADSPDYFSVYDGRNHLLASKLSKSEIIELTNNCLSYDTVNVLLEKP